MIEKARLIKGAIVLTAASESTAQQVFSPFNWKLMGLPVLKPSYLEPTLAQRVLLMGVSVVESGRVSTWEPGWGFGVGWGHERSRLLCLPSPS